MNKIVAVFFKLFKKMQIEDAQTLKSTKNNSA